MEDSDSDDSQLQEKQKYDNVTTIDMEQRRDMERFYISDPRRTKMLGPLYKKELRRRKQLSRKLEHIQSQYERLHNKLLFSEKKTEKERIQMTKQQEYLKKQYQELASQYEQLRIKREKQLEQQEKLRQSYAQMKAQRKLEEKEQYQQKRSSKKSLIQKGHGAKPLRLGQSQRYIAHTAVKRLDEVRKEMERLRRENQLHQITQESLTRSLNQLELAKSRIQKRLYQIQDEMTQKSSVFLSREYQKDAEIKRLLYQDSKLYDQIRQNQIEIEQLKKLRQEDQRKQAKLKYQLQRLQTEKKYGQKELDKTQLQMRQMKVLHQLAIETTRAEQKREKQRQLQELRADQRRERQKALQELRADQRRERQKALHELKADQRRERQKVLRELDEKHALNMQQRTYQVAQLQSLISIYSHNIKELQQRLMIQRNDHNKQRQTDFKQRQRLTTTIESLIQELKKLKNERIEKLKKMNMNVAQSVAIQPSFPVLKRNKLRTYTNGENAKVIYPTRKPLKMDANAAQSVAIQPSFPVLKRNKLRTYTNGENAQVIYPTRKPLKMDANAAQSVAIQPSFPVLKRNKLRTYTNDENAQVIYPTRKRLKMDTNAPQSIAIQPSFPVLKRDKLRSYANAENARAIQPTRKPLTMGKLAHQSIAPSPVMASKPVLKISKLPSQAIPVSKQGEVLGELGRIKLGNLLLTITRKSGSFFVGQLVQPINGNPYFTHQFVRFKQSQWPQFINAYGAILDRPLEKHQRIIKYIDGRQIAIIKDYYRGAFYMGARMCVTNQDYQTFPTRVGFNLKLQEAEELLMLMKSL